MKAATVIYPTGHVDTIISIHAAREGGDGIDAIGYITESLFQSTPPVKAATYAGLESTIAGWISIHAAREGGDGRHSAVGVGGFDFNPRRP